MNNSDRKKSGNVKSGKGFIAPVLSLAVICMAVGLLLSTVHGLTGEKIEENLKAAERSAIAEVYGLSGERASEVEYTALDGCPDGVNAVYAVKTGGTDAGYCVSVSPNGFGGNIDMVVGVGADGKIVGVAIVALSETPGLGSRVDDPAYLSGYNGKGRGLVLKKDVDAISGATISSRSVLTGVNRATEALASMGLAG